MGDAKDSKEGGGGELHVACWTSSVFKSVMDEIVCMKSSFQMRVQAEGGVKKVSTTTAKSETNLHYVWRESCHLLDTFGLNFKFI